MIPTMSVLFESMPEKLGSTRRNQERKTRAACEEKGLSPLLESHPSPPPKSHPPLHRLRRTRRALQVDLVISFCLSP